MKKAQKSKEKMRNKKGMATALAMLLAASVGMWIISIALYLSVTQYNVAEYKSQSKVITALQYIYDFNETVKVNYKKIKYTQGSRISTDKCIETTDTLNATSPEYCHSSPVLTINQLNGMLSRAVFGTQNKTEGVVLSKNTLITIVEPSGNSENQMNTVVFSTNSIKECSIVLGWYNKFSSMSTNSSNITYFIANRALNSTTWRNFMTSEYSNVRDESVYLSCSSVANDNYIYIKLVVEAES